MLASGGHSAEAARLLTAMAAAGFAPESAAYTLAIDAHARRGVWHTGLERSAGGSATHARAPPRPWQLAGAALQLLREMTSRGISPDLVSSVASLR